MLPVGTDSLRQQVTDLRGTVRDLFALSALPQLLVGQAADRVAETLGDSLFAMLRCDLVYVQVREPEHCISEHARAAWRPAPHTPMSRELREWLTPFLDMHNAEPVQTLRHPAGGGFLRLSVVPISRDGKMGVLAAASASPHFPTDLEQTLIEAAVNQACVALQTLRSEQMLSEARAELERRVLQRTLQLQESEERFRQIAETINEVFWVQDCPDGRTAFVSPAYETVFGRSCASLYADPRSFLETVHPDDRARVAAAYDHQLKGNDSDETYRIVRPNGSLGWVRDRAFVVRSKTGEAYRLVGIAEDITEVRQAMDALRESEQRFARAFHSNPAVQSITRIDDNHRYVNVNQACVELYGVPRAEIIGRTPPEVITVDPQSFAAVAGLLEQGRPVRAHEVEVVTKAGRAMDLVVSAEIIELDGERCALATAYDLTEHKRAAEQLNRALAETRKLTARLLQAQDEERRRLARQLHETTAQDLAAIKMNLAALERQSSGTDAELLRETMALTDRSMTEVRTLSYVLHPPFLDEAGIVSALRWYVRGFAARSGIAVRVDIPDDLPRLPQDVETTLFRIVQECLINIYRHAQSATATIRMRYRDDHLVLLVRDRGRGIGAAAPAAATVDAPLLGVGIAGMQERARQLGGCLEIVRRRVGMTVRAKLPFEVR